jgi:hypothetical protein
LADSCTPGTQAKSEKALTNSGLQLRLLAGDIAYMSRHPIFEQLPALKEDIKIPMDLIESTPGDKLEMFVSEFLLQRFFNILLYHLFHPHRITASWGPTSSGMPSNLDASAISSALF